MSWCARRTESRVRGRVVKGVLRSTIFLKVWMCQPLARSEDASRKIWRGCLLNIYPLRVGYTVILIYSDIIKVFCISKGLANAKNVKNQDC